MLDGLASILQAIVGLGLLNVWLVRPRSATAFRGGDAKNLKEEFATYGLPSPVFYIVGGLKILAGILLLVGFAYEPVVVPAAAVVAVLMAGAFAMHMKVGDPASKYVPATLMLIMCIVICAVPYV
ncbi:MAG: putative membrane protein YphA (DoxX/SURF4 family) [Hyphomicrobiaceae bacterium]|jgi:uncharacterized membrane protein YphA (DoxX/SURF4 family)